jgi:hypothetical protein
MKVRELKEILNRYNDTDSFLDNDVVVKLDVPSYGSSITSKVKSIRRGFDWDRDLIIYTEDSVVVKSENEELFDRSRDLILFLATKPLKKDTYEIRRAKDLVKLMNISDEEFLKIRKLLHKT